MNSRKSTAEQRLLEERLYAQVVQEVSQGIRRDGLWAKAIAESNGSNDYAKALYIRYRVQSLVDEAEVSFKRAQEDARRRQAEQDLVFKNQRREQGRLERNKTINSIGKLLFGTLAVFCGMVLISSVAMMIRLAAEMGFKGILVGSVNLVIFGPLLYWSIKKLREN